MDKKDAKLLLQALRPNGADAARPEFAEALALAASDPELKMWWEARQTFDRKIAAKLGAVPVPKDLRATILTSRKVEPIRPRIYYPAWLAAAALVALLCVAITFWHVSRVGPVDRGVYVASILPVLGHDSPHLAMLSSDRQQLMGWLKQQGAPVGSMPDKDVVAPIGCQKYVVHGHVVSLVCFTMTSGAIAHLFMIDKDALSDPPADNTPEYEDVDGWRTASWSRGRMSYMLATQADMDSLKHQL
ncbi:MAG: hypothetical protein WDO13_10980 [Verrucomicrobiota bacterium]